MKRLNKIFLTLFSIIILVALFFFVYKRTATAPKPVGQEGVATAEVPRDVIEVVAENLRIPWEIAFLPNNELLVTERVGNLVKIDSERTIIPISGVIHIGEGGLQGLALHPNFLDNQLLYLYFTTQTEDGLINRVERYRLTDKDTLIERTIIIDDIPGARFHDGGRILFGPDQKLYITTGDAGSSDRAQDRSFLGGKILRLNDDGSIPEDNPFGTAIYSFGHRNPQGLAWDDEGNIWSTEHGRSVPLSGYDELNVIVPGGNYGWPVVQGSEVSDNMVVPIINSGPRTTWAPAGAAYLDGSIFFAGLKGEALYEYSIASRELASHFFQEYGRLRAVALSPDGHLYLSTSNTDGRGTAQSGDDKIIRVDPSIFYE